MRTPPDFRIARASAFTLIELMVSLAVLAMLVVLVAQLTGSAASIATAGHKALDADSEARLVFDRMAVDLAGMVKRTDVDYVFKDGRKGVFSQKGDDLFAFYCESPGYYDPANTPPDSDQRRSLSLVGYRMIDGRLNRLAKGLGRGTSPSSTGREMAFLPTLMIRPSGTNAAAWPGIAYDPADADYQVLGSQVIRFEYWYQMKDGSFSTTPFYSASVNARLDGFKDVRAIVVAIAILDEKSRLVAGLDEKSRIEDPAGWTGRWKSLRDSFPDLTDPTSATSLPNLPAAWFDAVNSGTLVGAGKLPPPAAASIRVYCRAFPIGSPP